MEEKLFKKPVFPELEGTIAKNGLNYKSYGKLIGLNPRTVASRMAGESEFKLNEIEKTLELFNKEYKELFKRE